MRARRGDVPWFGGAVAGEVLVLVALESQDAEHPGAIGANKRTRFDGGSGEVDKLFRPGGVGDAEAGLAGGDTPSQLAQAQETFDRLRDLLPEDRRVILEMRAAGHSCKEIGERIGVSERTVQRVLEDLRARARIEG